MYYSSKTDRYLQYLLLTFGFLFPLSVFLGNFLAIVILISFLFLEEKRTKLFHLFGNKLFRSIAIFFFLHIVGLLWSEDIQWGLEMIRKMLEFGILFPVLIILMHKKNIDLYINSFLLAAVVIILFSFSIWLGLIPPFKNASIENPTPFMTHITHGPFIAFSSYISLMKFFNNFNSKNNISYLYLFLFLIFSFNVFITGGRAGHVVYLVLLLIGLIQYYGFRPKVFIMGVCSVLIIFITAYQYSGIFKKRIDALTTEIVQFNEEDNHNTSVGTRLIFLQNSLRIFKDNIFIGVGTGGFPKEYAKYNDIYSEGSPLSTNPHNMYLLLIVQFGLIGLLCLLSIHFYQIKHRIKNNKFHSHLGFGLVAYFFVINFSDSYLLGHFTSFLFIFFSSFLYQSEKY